MALLSNTPWHMFMQLLMLSFLVFGAIGLVVGIGLVVSSQKTFRVFQVVNRWVSTRSVLKQVELPRDTDRIAHKYRRWIGTAFIVLGAISIFGLIARIDVSALNEMLAKN